MNQLFSGTVEVHYGQAYIELEGLFDGDMESCFHGQRNGLCGAQNPNLLFLLTGLHTGKVGLTLRLFDTAPGIDDAWEEIVEVSFQAPSGRLMLIEWAADQGIELAIPAGAYRARYQGRAMQTANELDTNPDDTPVDSYCLDLWPASQAPDQVVKQTSVVAAYWHDWAQGLSAKA